jgi:hypothetical protein
MYCVAKLTIKKGIMYRRILSYSSDREGIERNLGIIKALIDFTATGERVWWNYILQKYNEGIIDGIINRGLDRLDVLCQNEYEKNQNKDKQKMTFNDWLNIDESEVIYVGVRYNSSGIAQGLSKQEYQRQYRQKRILEKRNRLEGIL